MSGIAPSWRRYQQEAAALLTELGFTTGVEDRITSTRGVTHEVDVSARRSVAGVEILWVAECKLWRSAVPKEKVAALAAIGEDLGADRCLLMSETGFQSGAIQMAAGRNITLTSLDDLRTNATADLLTARAHQAERRLREIEQQFRDWPVQVSNEMVLRVVGAIQAKGLLVSFDSEPEAGLLESNVPKLPGSWPAGLDIAEAKAITEVAHGIRVSLDQASLARWPVLVEDHEGRQRIACNSHQLLGVVEPVLAQLEGRLSTQQRRVQDATGGEPSSAHYNS